MGKGERITDEELAKMARRVFGLKPSNGQASGVESEQAGTNQSPVSEIPREFSDGKRLKGIDLGAKGLRGAFEPRVGQNKSYTLVDSRQLKRRDRRYTK